MKMTITDPEAFQLVMSIIRWRNRTLEELRRILEKRGTKTIVADLGDGPEVIQDADSDSFLRGILLATRMLERFPVSHIKCEVHHG